MENSKENLDKVSKSIEKLRELMKKYLSIEGSSSGMAGGGGSKTPDPPVEYGKRIDKIVLEEEKSSVRFPKGTVIPLIVKCYEKKEDKYLPVKDPKLNFWYEESKGSFIEFVGSNSVKGLKEGYINVCFESKESNIKSNILTLEIVSIEKIKVKYPKKVKKKESKKIKVDAFNNQGHLLKNILYQFSVETDEGGRISRTGVFTAGVKEGDIMIKIKYGESENKVFTFFIKVSPEEYERKGGGNKGGSLPLILFCSRMAPGTEDLPEEYRTIPASDIYPTIIDNDPYWEGKVIWINPLSKESKKFRERGDGQLVGVESEKFKVFLILKGFEILKRLKLKEYFSDKEFSYAQLINALSDSERECSNFIDEAHELFKEMIIKNDN